MGLFNFFDKNKDYLRNKDEKLCSSILFDIVKLIHEAKLSENLPMKKRNESSSYDIYETDRIMFEIEQKMEQKKEKQKQIDEEIGQLAVYLYYLSFKRTNKKAFDLQKARNPLIVIKEPNALKYVGIYNTIVESTKKVLKNPLVDASQFTEEDADKMILQTLKLVVESINKMK